MNDEKIENNFGRRLQHVVPILIAMTASLTTTPAPAQSTTAATATAADANESSLAEVLVTASKRGAQSIQAIFTDETAERTPRRWRSVSAHLPPVRPLPLSPRGASHAGAGRSPAVRSASHRRLRYGYNPVAETHASSA
jgi:hypothetical protein